MAESAPHSDAEAKKRRSTRIVQAVPLTVTGVDALGRPFQERTSTLIVNCHGCRYQSKHYVLKNMWVTLEVPHPEAGQAPRNVRAKVMWIQRPRTVRELFQIGVELEVPGNFWGIAFPPDDWFPFPDSVEREIPALRAVPEQEAGRATEEAEAAEPVREDNVRVLPVPGGAESSVAMARQMARLVAETRQQVQQLAREAAVQAAETQTQTLLAAMQSQLQEAAERAVQASAAPAIEAAVQQALARIEEARTTGAGAVHEEWSREAERRMKEAAEQLAAHLAQAAEAQRGLFEQQLESQLNQALASLKDLGGEAGARVESAAASLQQFRKELDETTEAARRRLQEMVEGRTEEAQKRLEELQQAAGQLSDAIAASATTARAGWRARLEDDLAAAAAHWNEKIQASLESAAKQAAERLMQHSQDAVERLEQEIATRVTSMRESFEHARGEAESTLTALRATLSEETALAQASLGELRDTASRMQEYSERLDELSKATSDELQRRFEAVLATESSELNRRAESAVAGMAERLQPVLEAAGQQSLERLAAELEQNITPHVDRAKEILRKLSASEGMAEEILRAHQQRLRQTADQTTSELDQHLTMRLDRANEIMKKLSASQGLAEETLRAHQQRLQRASDQFVHENVGRLQDALGRFEKEFQEAGRAATTKWLAELEAKATDTMHTTFEALYKSSEWYEKKVQTHMQGALERGVEQTANSLREKAGELSGVFATELDHYSRSYVEHTQGQMDEAVKDATDRGRAQLAKAMETTATAFSDDAGRVVQRELERFKGSVGSVFEQTSARLDAHAVQVQSKIDAEAKQFYVDFQKGMTQQIQQGVAQARQELETQVAPVKESWRTEREEQEHLLRQKLAHLGDESIDAYKKRLENVSNSWLVTTVTTLSQQSQDMIVHLANSAEQRLRETCSQVLAGVGETLRQRLLDISSNLSSPNPPAEKK